MASRAVDVPPQLAAFRRLVRDARKPARLAKNPLAARVCGGDGTAFAAALRVSLFRLPARQREIVARYDLNGEEAAMLCASMALSRRQFFRDHRAAIERLAAMMLPPGTDAAAARSDATVTPLAPPRPAASLAAGLHGAGAYGEAIAVLRRALERAAGEERDAAALAVAELQVESGDAGGAQATLDALAAGALRPGATPALRAHAALVAGHLASTHPARQERYERARAILEAALRDRPPSSAEAVLLVKALHALALSHDHRGSWPAARRAAREAMVATEAFALLDTPLGVGVRANEAMRDARQFGNVDGALDALHSCLATALHHGWIQAAGDIVVHFINLNLMRSHYAQAIAWHRYIACIDDARFSARTRNFIAVDIAHALTMLGQPARALAMLRAGSDEGLAFAGAREYWRAEALQASGDAGGALALASRALDAACDACSQKGQARSKRVVARSHHALGHARSARRAIGECLELSERYVSPYDLLLSMTAARGIDGRSEGDDRELARLLRGKEADAAYGPPPAVSGRE